MSFPFAIVGFDLDGTLCDTAPDLGAAVNHALSTIGRPPVQEGAVRSLIGGGARLMLTRALALTGGADGVDIDALFAALLAHYDEHIADHTKPFPGSEAVLDKLAERGVKLAVVTNKREAFTLKLLEELGLGQRFDCVIGPDSAGVANPKPAADPLVTMRERLGGGRAAYVGDSSFDVHAAREARMTVVAVSFGYHDVPPVRLGADAVIDHWDALIPALERL